MVSGSASRAVLNGATWDAAWEPRTFPSPNPGSAPVSILQVVLTTPPPRPNLLQRAFPLPRQKKSTTKTILSLHKMKFMFFEFFKLAKNEINVFEVF